MGKGLLAQWRRGVAARGLLGAALFAVPVAVAAAIGFGTSLSGIAGGLTSFAEGPATTTTSDTSPRKLNRAVVALASRPESAFAPTGGGSGPSTTGDGGGGGGGGAGSIPGDGTTTGGGTTSGGSGGSGGSTDSGSPTINPTDVELPGTGGGTGGTVDTVDSTVGGTVDTVDSTVDNTVDGALQDLGNTVNGILGQ